MITAPYTPQSTRQLIRRFIQDTRHVDAYHRLLCGGIAGVPLNYPFDIVRRVHPSRPHRPPSQEGSWLEATGHLGAPHKNVQDRGGVLPTVAGVTSYGAHNFIALNWWRLCATVPRPLMSNLVAAKEEGLVG